jgi:hypothetical protein
MANELIKHKELWARLNNIRQNDWIKAAETLGLVVLKSTSGTSHTHTIRDPKNQDPKDIRGLITTLQVNLYKQANQGIFISLVKFGMKEDDVWKALGML